MNAIVSGHLITKVRFKFVSDQKLN